MNNILLIILFISALYIAYKVGRNTKSKGSTPPKNEPNSAQVEVLPVVPAVIAASEFTEYALQDSEGNAVLSVTHMPTWVGDTDGRKFRALNTKASDITRLAPMLNALPSLVQSGAAHNKGFMQVIVNGALHPGKMVDTFSPVVRNTNGTIKEWAVLKDAKSLQNAAKLTAVFQVASVIVAQQHLADISQKLRTIEQGINSIKGFLDAQRIAVITGTLAYLQQAHSAISAGDISPKFRDELDRLEIDLLRVQKHLFDELEELAGKTASIEDPDTFGSEGLVKAITEHQDKIERSLNALLLCINTRVVNWQVLSAYPGEIKNKLIREESIKRAFNDMMGNNGLCSKLSEKMSEKISSIKAFWNQEETLELRKRDLKSSFKTIEIEFRKNNDLAQASLASTTQKLMNYEANPLTLGLKIENGQIVEAVEVVQN